MAEDERGAHMGWWRRTEKALLWNNLPMLKCHWIMLTTSCISSKKFWEDLNDSYFFQVVGLIRHI